MNGLTLELFEALAGAELDEGRRQMVFGCLSALLKMPWLDDSEKHNALILLDYLEGLEGGEVFAIALHEAVPPRQVCLVVNENRPLSLAAEAFLRFLSAGSPGGEAGGG